MKPRDPRKPLETTMPQTIGLACGHPTTLLLLQPTQHQIEMPMIFPFRMFTLPTGRAATFVNRQLRRHLPTPSLEWTAAYTKRGISRNRSWTGSYVAGLSSGETELRGGSTSKTSRGWIGFASRPTLGCVL